MARRLRVLFVCWHNAARSQMAEAFFERCSGHSVTSAGTHSAGMIHPLVIEVMREVGIDMHGRWPRPLTDALVADADVIVRCLAPDPDDYAWPESHARFLDWSLPMPKDEAEPTLAELRTLRDAVAARVADLAKELEA